MTALAWTAWVALCAGCSSFRTLTKVGRTHSRDASWVNEQVSSDDPLNGDGWDNVSDRPPENAVVATGHLDDQGGTAGDASHALTPLANPPTTNPQLIGGTQLGAAQMTATEHALRLKEENMRMKHAGQKLMADARYLRAEIERKDALLVRVQDAMALANEELAAAGLANQRLKQKIDGLANQQQQQKMATDRMLTLIRVELDDALMREITSVQE